MNLPQVETEWFACAEAAGVILFVYRKRCVRPLCYLYAREDEEQSQLDIVHAEGAIPALVGYLLLDDRGDRF